MAQRLKARLPAACHLIFLAFILLMFGGCSTNPPGADFPRTLSNAIPHSEQTRLGVQFAKAAEEHGGKSGFRIITAGVDGFLARVQMIDSAERSLDLQYFIFRGDETGRLITDALLRAANRGVRIRVLIDDADTVPGDEQILALTVHPEIEIRIFNPFSYRGHVKVLRALEFLFNASRLDYRMHNKLIVVDNTVALVGGRNIGNQYFQVDPTSQFADDDVFAAGPIVGLMSATFDEYWNSRLAIPTAAISRKAKAAVNSRHRRARADHSLLSSKGGGIDYAAKIATGEPYAGIISGHLSLVWAPARVVCDSPDKKNVEMGVQRGHLMSRPLIAAANAVQSELLLVTPYFIPAADELKLLHDLRARSVSVSIITNSLESTVDILAQAAYSSYRKPLLKHGVEIREIRALLGNVHGSGQTARISRYGNYGLHAKLFVFDRQKIFIGSMNYDQRSKRLNTEIGVIIDSPELAQQTAARFAAMAQPANSYALALQSRAGRSAKLVWRTEEQGSAVEYSREPAQNAWKRLAVNLLSLLPFDREL